MMEVLASLPALSEPLTLGISGAVLTLAGSVLHAALTPAPRKIGGCCCVLGLTLMAIGFLCISSNTSLLAYAQRM